jgi:hypothetical protein
MRFNWQACFFTATSFEQIRGLGKKKGENLERISFGEKID